MGQDDRAGSLGDGTALPAQLVEALLLLCQGDFSYRLQRSRLRDRDDTVAFFFNAIAEELERLIPRRATTRRACRRWWNVSATRSFRVASGDFSIEVERDYRGDAPDVLVFLVNNTISELAEFVADSDRRAEDDRQRLEELVQSRTRELELLATTDELTGLLNRRRILEVAAEECQRLARYPEMLCFALFDIDHFKSINDLSVQPPATRRCGSSPGPRRRSCDSRTASDGTAAKNSWSSFRKRRSTARGTSPNACAGPLKCSTLGRTAPVCR